MSTEQIFSNKKRGKRHARHNVSKKKKIEKESEDFLTIQQNEVLPFSTATNIVFNPKQVYVIFKLFYI